jgi:DNA uptake protein ComE-like DNA-binding protein
MKLTRSTLAALAALALFAPAYAQAPATAPAARTVPAPTMPAATSPTIPTRVAPSAAPMTSAAATPAVSMKKIDINAASETEIATLPGIGPVTAKAIVDGRPWDDVNALSTKKVVSQPVFARNKDRFALADINTSSVSDIAKTLPGIGDKTAPKIVAGRPYATPQDLVTKKILTAAQFAKIKDVITY